MNLLIKHNFQCNAIIEEEDMTKYLTIADVDEKLRQHEQQPAPPPPPPQEFTTLKKSDILNEAIKCMDDFVEGVQSSSGSGGGVESPTELVSSTIHGFPEVSIVIIVVVGNDGS